MKNLTPTPPPTGISRINVNGMRPRALSRCVGIRPVAEPLIASLLHVRLSANEPERRRLKASPPHPFYSDRFCARRRRRHPTTLKNAFVPPLLLGAALCELPRKRWVDFKVRHAWVGGIPQGWEAIGPAPSDHRLTARIGLKHDGIEVLIGHLYAVIGPNHHR